MNNEHVKQNSAAEFFFAVRVAQMQYTEHIASSCVYFEPCLCLLATYNRLSTMSCTARLFEWTLTLFK